MSYECLVLFNQVKSWIKELKRILGDDIVLCIVANKIDLEKDRHVSAKTAAEYASSVNAKLYSTSAKLDKGIEQLFNDLAKRKFRCNRNYDWFVVFRLGMLAKMPAVSNGSSMLLPKDSRTRLQPIVDGDNRKKNDSCC
jgi:50S ribosomal subunit-associated GTPase HflX